MAGWDPATGLGTINFRNLKQASGDDDGDDDNDDVVTHTHTLTHLFTSYH